MLQLVLDGEVFAWNQKRGVARVYREILLGLPDVDPGINVSIVHQGPMLAAEVLSEQVVLDPVKSLSREMWPWAVWQHLRPFADKALARRRWRELKADVFHTTHYNMPVVRQPMFCMVHDMIPELFPERFPRQAGEKIRKRKRRAVTKAKLVLCVSENTQRDVVRLLDVPEEKCRVVYNAGFDSSFADQFADAGNDCKLFILYVGGFKTAYKNFSLLVDALAPPLPSDLQGIGLKVVGPEELDDGEQRDLRDRLGGIDIEFLRGVNDQKLATLYSTCAAYVMPSLYEGFGIPVLEAFACGAPVACSRAASLPEVGGDVAHYFDPQSPEELRHALANAIEEERAPEHVARRRAWAARFSWDDTARGFAQAARDVAGM